MAARRKVAETVIAPVVNADGVEVLPPLLDSDVANFDKFSKWLKTKMTLVPTQVGSDTLGAISIGSIMIDEIIGGRLSKTTGKPLCPGFPRGRISEVYGPEASGKTTLALQAAVQCQRQGGRVLFLDYEHAISVSYAEALGVNMDPSRFTHLCPDTLEDGFTIIYAAIRTGYDLIIVDSVAAMIPAAEFEKDAGAVARIGARASKLSELIPKLVKWAAAPWAGAKKKEKEEGDDEPVAEEKKGPKIPSPRGLPAIVLLNQVRATITAHGGDETSSGGKTIKFFASLRLKVVGIRKEYIKVKDSILGTEVSKPYGTHTSIQVIKNKMSPNNGYRGEVFIRHGMGVDDYYTVLEAAIRFKYIKNTKTMYAIPGHLEEPIRGREKFLAWFRANPAIYEEIRDKVVAVIHASVEVKPTDMLSGVIQTAAADGDSEDLEDELENLDDGSTGEDDTTTDDEVQLEG